MNRKIFLPITLLGMLLSGCSSGVSSSEKFVCEALFESWPKIDFFEANNFLYLYQTSGVSRLGDNSESSILLSQNSRMASELRAAISENDDEELSDLVRLHQLKWTKASNDGLLIMRSVIGTAKDGRKSLNNVQTNLMVRSSKAIIEAGTLAIQIRSQCIEIGFQKD